MSRSSLPLYSSHVNKLVAPAPEPRSIYDLFEGSDLNKTGGYYNSIDSGYLGGQKVSSGNVDTIKNLALKSMATDGVLDSQGSDSASIVTPDFFYQQSNGVETNLQGLTEPPLFFGLLTHDINKSINGQIDLTEYGLTYALQVLVPDSSTPLPAGSIVTYVEVVKPDGTRVIRNNGIVQPEGTQSFFGDIGGLLFQYEDKDKSSLLMGLCIPTIHYFIIGRALSESDIIVVENHFSSFYENSDVNFSQLGEGG